MNTLNVTKASGEMEPYDESKLRRSLAGAGADKQIIDRIADAINDMLYDGISTQKIYRHAFRLLKSYSARTAGRYKLKEALLELGPTGYPFEQFTAELLNRLDYNTQTTQVIEGNCVSHEVDVVAEKEKDHFIIECKFHNRKDHKCNVQVPLYIQSRYEDIKRKLNHDPEYQSKAHFGWIVTNTRFTEDARQYAECIGLRLLSWDYPENKGLKDLIGQVNLHPITCLSSIDKNEKSELLKRDVVFCQQLQDDGELLNDIGISDKRKDEAIREAKAVSAFNTGR
jgi:hypothetical protein